MLNIRSKSFDKENRNFAIFHDLIFPCNIHFAVGQQQFLIFQQQQEQSAAFVLSIYITTSFNPESQKVCSFLLTTLRIVPPEEAPHPPP
ncbi:hypothetical protein CEXT_305211 [Caerostris extrusa]|uniref:Uncharacterized protein n=1 Tax=Caerostris extrusa TaxID=172846 RepID=A0AAV4XB36_CAEEX|nr:hypothetical protein CEXT_305211 [Caerostris extrusa]